MRFKLPVGITSPAFFNVFYRRKKIFFEKIERYRKIEKEMLSGKNVKKFNQKDAVEYLESL